MAKQAPQVEMDERQTSLLMEWDKAKAALDTAKAQELKSRQPAINAMPFDPDKDEGGQTLRLGDSGWSLKLDRPMYYTVDKDNELVQATLKKLYEHNPQALTGLIKWSAEISTKQYKALTDDERLILAPIITIKPGIPSLELTAPTVKKER